MSQSFFTQRFYLDTPSDRYTRRGGENFVGPFKSFWVSNTNNSNFECDLVINPRNEMSSRGIPLRLNQCQSIEDKPEGACIEFKTAQPGVWIDITFAQDDKLQVGSIVVESSGAVLINGGSIFDNDKYPVTNAAAILLPATDQRASSSIYNQTGEAFYIGSMEKISAADFMDTCIKIKPGNDIPFVWDLPGELWCRKEAAGTIYPVILNKVK